MASEQGLVYTLCGLSAIGVVLNMVLLAWQVVMVKVERGFSFIKHALILLDLAYCLVGLGIMFVLLSRETDSDFLCKAGGFLVIFATQETFWLLATASIGLYLWRKRQLSQDFQRWNRAIFYLVTIAQCVVLMPVSFLPLVNMSYFNSIEEYYFPCTPLHLPGTQGWALSALVLVLDWVAFVIALGALTLVSVRYSTCRTAHYTNVVKYFESGIPAKRLQRMLFVCFSIGVGFWLLPLLLTSVSYFSGGGLDEVTVQLALGFLLVLTLMAQPLCLWGYQFLAVRFLRHQANPVEKHASALAHAIPERLNHTTKLYSADPGIWHYLTQWRDVDGNLVAGVMRVFGPSTHLKWENELRVAVKLGLQNHPNIASFLWAAPDNLFTHPIREFTGDIIGKHSSIICRAHYPHGTLKEFLQYSVDTLTDRQIYRITADIAGGLNFLHKHGIVHNALTAMSVHMTGGDEKSGFRVAIGDFERSFEVLPTMDKEGPLHLSHSPLVQTRKPSVAIVETHLDFAERLGANRFAPDIRAFGMVTLCVLVAKSEYDEKMASEKSMARPTPPVLTQVRRPSRDQVPVPSVHTLCTAFKEPQSDYLRNDEFQNKHGTRESSHSHGSCTCSQRVADVRVLRDKGPDSRNSHTSSCRVNLGNSAESMDSAFGDRESIEQLSNSSSEDLKQDNSTYTVVSKNGWHSGESIRQSSKSLGSLPSSSDSLSSPMWEGSDGRDSDAESRCSSRVSLRRGAHKILTNGSFITSPRTTPESGNVPVKVDAATDTCNFPIPEQSSEMMEGIYSSADCVLTEVREAPPPPPARDYAPMERAVQHVPVGGGFFPRRGSIQTIYEEEESAGNDSGSNGATPNMSESVSHRHQPTVIVPLRKESLDALELQQLKRYSLASTMDDSVIESMIDSVISADSGMGSSHYDTMSNVTDPDGGFPGNNSGMRSGIYSSYTDRTSTGAPVHRYVQKSQGLGKSKNARKLRIKGYKSNPEKGSEVAGEDTVSLSGSVHSEASGGYEHLPDVAPLHPPALPPQRKEKRPCVGHHKYLDGSQCHAFCKAQKSDTNAIAKPTSLFKSKPKIPPKPKYVADNQMDLNNDNNISQETPHSTHTQSNNEFPSHSLRTLQFTDNETYPELSHPSAYGDSNLYDAQDYFTYGKHIQPIVPAARSDRLHDGPQPLRTTSGGLELRRPQPVRGVPKASVEAALGSSSSSPSEERSSSSSLHLDDPLSPTSGGGLPRPLTQYQHVTSNPHSDIYANLDTTEEEQEVRAIVDFMKTRGKLGFYTDRLVPLLADCYSENPSLSTEAILQRLEDDMPSASVV